jgi:hypothetical protein
MRKSLRKLSLSRETVLQLSPKNLHLARGGTESDTCPWNTQAPTVDDCPTHFPTQC